jgi:hypothetical protein
MTKIQMTTATVSVLLLVSAIVADAQSSGAAPSNRRPRITGTFTDAANGLGVFSGTFTLTRFAVENSAVVSIGTLVGSLADSMGNPIGRVDQEAILPVADVTATCDVLRLELGPAEIEILGTTVVLRRDVLGITVRDGSAQTFGPLLCSSAKLLDSHPAPAIVAAVLNEMLRAMDR